MDSHQGVQWEPPLPALPPPPHQVFQAKQELPLSRLQRMRLLLWSLRHRQQLPGQQSSLTEATRLAKDVELLVALCCGAGEGFQNHEVQHSLGPCEIVNAGLSHQAKHVCAAAANKIATLLPEMQHGLVLWTDLLPELPQARLDLAHFVQSSLLLGLLLLFRFCTCCCCILYTTGHQVELCQIADDNARSRMFPVFTCSAFSAFKADSCCCCSWSCSSLTSACLKSVRASMDKRFA